MHLPALISRNALKLRPARATSAPTPPPRRLIAVLAWLQVSFLRHRLDLLLADGADPTSSPALWLRSRELTSRRTRDRLAASIEDLLRSSDPGRRWDARILASRRSLSAAGPDLRRIAVLLRSSAPVCAHGVALSSALVHDGSSPLYGVGEAGAAWYWSFLAAEALQGG